jgi:hypothetical protein
VAEEIDNKTIMTVVTKPVQRPIFIFVHNRASFGH